MHGLKGLGVAMVTPFLEGGMVDYNGLEKLVKHLHAGADYLVVMGTTGEAATLSSDEQSAILDFIIDKNANKLPIVFGMGGNNTAALTTKMQAFDKPGVSAFLTASPHYNKPSQEGIYRHYDALSQATSKPLIMYNVPGRTGSNVLPQTVVRIAEDCPNIIGIKEAAGNIEQVMELARALPERFLLISGDDALALPHVACGGHGVISVLGNAFPERFSAVLKASANGEMEKARELHFPFLPLIDALFAEGNPGGVKEALHHLGICENHVRLPLWPVSKNLSDEIKRLVAGV